MAILVCLSVVAAAPAPEYAKQATWAATVRAARAVGVDAALAASDVEPFRAAWWQRLEDDFPIECDWVAQDGGLEIAPWFEARADTRWEQLLIRRALEEAPLAVPGAREFETLCAEAPGPEDPRWLDLYAAVCAQRRAQRLETVRTQAPRIVFTKRRTIRPSFFAYTEGQSDAQNERHFLPGSELCLLELDGMTEDAQGLPGGPGDQEPGRARLQPSRSSFDSHPARPEPRPTETGKSMEPRDVGQTGAHRGLEPQVPRTRAPAPRFLGRARTLHADPGGVIRDPAVSWDGERVVFAWKRSLDDDDYHLYELDVRADQLRPITAGLGFADYEPAYLPNGDLIFASTRCVQTVDCWWTEVSNLYTCDPDGRHLRRLTFDQVHSIYPQVLDDGRVIYTRWDYNDRGQVFPQALFQMQPDGTGQAEFYGNNSWFPTTMAHGRGIPGTERVLAILCGHHTSQAGKLAILDPARGRHENQGVQLVAPRRDTPAERIDGYGQAGELWQYPYPLNEREFLVGYAPRGWADSGGPWEGDARFGIYWMDVDGRRELLASDPRLPSQQPVPLVPRRRPARRPSTVDYAQTTGTYYLQDVQAGPALTGVPRGTVARLRVVALEFRPAGIGENGSSGPGGGALISTPIAIGNGSWDVKVVLGETPVQADGSAFFRVPARTPVYFQAVDTNGYVVQTMRSWSTLQPGEVQSCVGCHEHKNSAPPTEAYRGSLALRAGPRDLEPFYGPPRGFSFAKEIQPILDHHCIRCHDQRQLRPRQTRLAAAVTREADPDWTRVLPVPEAEPAASAVPADATAEATSPAFSLLGATTEDPLAKRHWSDAYLNLTLAWPREDNRDRGAGTGVYDGEMVNWIGSQSVPTPLPPYAAGAARSALFPLLARGHYGVRLSREERDKLACWVDLLVPYCGDYREAAAWTAAEREKFERYVAKRRRMEAVEREHLRAGQARRGDGRP